VRAAPDHALTFYPFSVCSNRCDAILPEEIWRKAAMFLVRKLFNDREGVTVTEYALIAALVACVIIGGVSLVGSNVSKVFSTVAHTI
jgi:pilus assembly protein Flp/PilA